LYGDFKWGFEGYIVCGMKRDFVWGFCNGDFKCNWKGLLKGILN